MTTADAVSARRRRWEMPDTYVIVFGVLVMAAFATYVVSPGTFERAEVDGITRVVPDSYTAAERAPASFMDVFLALQTGMVQSAGLIFLVLFAGGMFEIVERSGAIRAGIVASVTTIAMFVVNSIFNFFVPSGSGQAAIMIPIQTPLADMIGLTRQTTILAFQYGDGFSNSLYPTSGPRMASLAMASVPWLTWARWFFPLFLIWSGIAIVLLLVATAIGLGPL